MGVGGGHGPLENAELLVQQLDSSACWAPDLLKLFYTAFWSPAFLLCFAQGK